MNDNNSKKNQAHHLKAVVLIGSKGLTEQVHNEIERCLLSHELIKIRIGIKDRDERLALTNRIIDYHGADLINQIGQTIVIYKAKPED